MSERMCAAPLHPVVLVGAATGASDLLTLRAVRALRRATVALVDDLVDPGTLKYLRKSVHVVHVGKRGGCKSTPQAFIHRLMIAEARRGERVVRLKGGDPFVFGRRAHECDALRQAGIDVEVISGLPAGVAAPASIGVPVTDRRYSRGVAFVTGHAGDGQPDPDWAALAASGLTLVIYMGVSRVRCIADALRRGGLRGDTPAAVGCSANTAQQRELLCTLQTLADDVLRHELPSPAILVIDEVISLAPDWSAIEASPDQDRRHEAPEVRTALG